MEVGVLKSELVALESKARRQMIALLLTSEEKDNQEYRQELGRRLDDKDPTHWISLDELDRRPGTGWTERLMDSFWAPPFDIGHEWRRVGDPRR
jgi:hypothetical protein